MAPSNEDFPIVAIGASAGGIEAFRQVLEHLPADTGMAYVYVQHLDPDHKSNLAGIFSRSTKMKVREVTDKLSVRPDEVYILPPRSGMTIVDGKLLLNMQPAQLKPYMPINQFFLSLAENYKEKAIGIILSGNLADGTIGLKAIKSAGGITFAQDESAQFQGMPQNAISEDAVDLVLPPARIAEELARLSQHEQVYHSAIQALNEEMIDDRNEDLLAILKQVHSLFGVDFTQYKTNTLKRRIIRRMILQGIDNLKEYAAYLKSQPNEASQLYQDFLINVTTFFRDGEHVDYLKSEVLPRLLQSKSMSESIRFWVPACSTGQEAYSLAMLMMDAMAEAGVNVAVQIFATDLSEVAINKARLGIYSKDEVADVPPQVLQKYFMKIDGSYRIIKAIRDLCVFATHNVIKDPPFSRVDLVSCCNLLIYLEANLQKKLLTTFNYALNHNGYLVLGKSETIGPSASLFSQLNKKLKIYAKKKDAAAKAMFEMSYTQPDEKKGVSGRKTLLLKEKSDEIDLEKSVDALLLKKYTPASVVVNQDLDILQFRGATGLFLEPSPGKASLNLLKMAREGLAFELRTLVYKADKSAKPELKNWVEVKNDKAKSITIEVVPLMTDGVHRYFLVVFNEDNIDAADTMIDASKDKRVKQLEAELATIREDLRAYVEAQEAANEELQSVNEEIVSSNEELQSINEELETSKEELESSNEELATINQELNMRNEQLAEVQEYSEAMFATVRESLLILDKNLRIKTANTCFYKTFNVTEEETTGKLLYDIGNRQWDIPRLRELLEEIIPRNAHISDFEVTHRFDHIGQKVMLLNARRLVRKLHSEHLILLAIEDITAFVQAQQIVQEREQWFRTTADNAPVMIWMAGADRKTSFVNKAWLEFRGIAFDQAIGRSWVEDMHPDDREKVIALYDDSYEKRAPFSVEYRAKNKGGEYIWITSHGQPNHTHDGEFIGFIGSCMEMPAGEKGQD
jgi:two-component system, chemotaxis family, CheB/CheR fusion protein